MTIPDKFSALRGHFGAREPTREKTEQDILDTICWFGFIGQELLILGFWRTRIVDSTQIENQHSGRRMTFWKYTFPFCWSETTKWVYESTKWEYISTKWATETAKGVTETTKWESKKQQSGQRVLYQKYYFMPKKYKLFSRNTKYKVSPRPK